LQVNRNKRRCDVAGQYGPHGFMLLLPQTADQGALTCCRRLRPVLEAPQGQAAGAASVQVHFGIAALSPETATVTSLLARAEERLEQGRTNPLKRLAN
jgi:diguanylate cyclase (GGDEF)-like protein